MISNALSLDLAGKDWQFASAKHGASAPSGAWKRATVPGNVHTDLMALGLLKDPHLGLNEADMGWVEPLDWWYKKVFVVDHALFSSSRIILRAEGLDTYATVYVNGKKAGASQNSFVEHEWDVKRLLKVGRNEIVVRLASPTLTLKKLVARYGEVPAVGDSDRVYARKAQYSFGWDWGPRLVTSGIFKAIKLEGQQAARISDLHAAVKVISKAQARGTVSLDVEAIHAHATVLVASMGPWRVEKKIKLKKGLNHIALPFSIDTPRLWWPVGYGQPHLYSLIATLESGEAASTHVGLRQVKLIQEKDKEGENFIFEVNGVRVYIKGANWIPADTFMGRLTEGRVRRLVDLARNSNMNLLRIWGGGFYESEEFYKACDEKGILVWQDFPFACSEVPELGWFKKEVEHEAIKAIRRLRRHASLAFWCGSNENHQARHDHWFKGKEGKTWGDYYYAKLLPRLTAQLDAATPYWPGSPYGGKDPSSMTHGDRHNWAVWAQMADYMAYREDSGRFLSEFGFAALPNRAVLEKSIPKAERYVQSMAMEVHDKVGGAGAFARIAYYINAHLPESAGFDDFRYLSQVNQSEALVTGIEHWRRRQFNTSGTVFWQLNDCWPVTCWSVLDSDDTPKLAWHAVRRAYDPLLLSALEERGPLRYDRTGRLPVRGVDQQGELQAWISHEWQAPVAGTLTVELWNARGRRRRIYSGRVSVAAQRSVKVFSRSRALLKIAHPDSEYAVIRFAAPGLERRAIVYFERPKRQAFEDPGLQIKARRAGEVTFVTVRARRLARYVELSASQSGSFSDNGFDLLPGETRTLVFTSKERGGAPRFSAKTLNAIARQRA